MVFFSYRILEKYDQTCHWWRSSLPKDNNRGSLCNASIVISGLKFPVHEIRCTGALPTNKTTRVVLLKVCLLKFFSSCIILTVLDNNPILLH